MGSGVGMIYAANLTVFVVVVVVVVISFVTQR